MDWNASDVVGALEDYRSRKIATLSDLRTAIQALTGIGVSEMTLSRRIRGLRTRNSSGRPAKTALHDSSNTRVQVGVASRVCSPLPASPNSSFAAFVSTQVSSSPSSPRLVSRSANRPEVTKGYLSKRLTTTILTVPVGNGFVHQYYLTKQSQDGSTQYYRCSKCQSLHRKSKMGILAKVTIQNGVILSQEPVHHAECHPLKGVQAFATKIDRKCKVEVREGNFGPREIYNKGHEQALKLLQKLGDLHSADSVAACFPDWNSVQQQYGNHRRKAKLRVIDGYCLPDFYQITQRGRLSGNNERWVLHTCKKQKVIMFAADNDLQLAVHCNTLVGDATFLTCPKGFRQLSTVHAKVIDCYLSLIATCSDNDGFLRIHSFKTYFYIALCSRGFAGVLTWMKNVDIFSKDLLFFPMNINGNHWVLTVVDMRQSTITYFNSTGGDGDQHLNRICQYLQAESAAKKRNINLSTFTTLSAKGLPHQTNGYDCGVFLCQFANHLAREAPLTFCQANMPAF